MWIMASFPGDSHSCVPVDIPVRVPVDAEDKINELVDVDSSFIQVTKDKMLVTDQIEKIFFKLFLENTVTQKDVNNVKANVSDLLVMRHKSDPISAESFDPILVYKPQGTVKSLYPSLTEDAFFVVFQSKFQLQQYQLYASNILCLDSTHGTNAYRFKLITLMVADEFGHVSFCRAAQTNATSHDQPAVFLKKEIINSNKKPAHQWPFKMTTKPSGRKRNGAILRKPCLQDKENVIEMMKTKECDITDGSKSDKAVGSQSNKKKKKIILKEIGNTKTRDSKLVDFLENLNRKLYYTQPDGNCLFHALSHQIFRSEEQHSFLRLLVQKLENLNQDLFSKYLTDINEKTMKSHITKTSAWGTHVEMIAFATYFKCPIHIAQKNNKEAYTWRIVNPLQHTNFRFPVLCDTP
uniref:OTU domain-containing protein n=1 Tax=Amphimedon queenslandica TaxID=400682 RepID=A0A1X7UY78_AMPQE